MTAVPELTFVAYVRVVVWCGVMKGDVLQSSRISINGFNSAPSDDLVTHTFTHSQLHTHTHMHSHVGDLSDE